MKVLVYIGEMGSGKSYHAERDAADLGYAFVEGDSLGSRVMQEAISEFKLITRSMVDDLVHSLALKLCAMKYDGVRGVVVSQALYSKRHRESLRWLCSIPGIAVEFVWVKVGWIRNVRQLLKRERGWRWVLYWLTSKPFFEKPDCVRYLARAS